MRKILVFCIFIWSGLVAGYAYAGPQYSWQSYFDASGQMQLEDLGTTRFEPGDSFMHFDVQPGVLWIKFALSDGEGDADSASQPLFLKFVRPSVDRVTVYLPGAQPVPPGLHWRGETLSAKELQAGKRLYFGGAVDTRPLVFFVRLQTRGMHWIEPQLLTVAERADQRQGALVVLSAHLGLALMVLMALGVQFVQRPRGIYPALAVMNLVLLVWRANFDGFLIDWLGLNAYHFAAVTPMGAVVIVLVLPVLALVGLAEPGQHVARGLRVYAWAAVLLTLLAYFSFRGLVILTALLLAHGLVAELVYSHFRARDARRAQPKRVIRIDRQMSVLFLVVLLVNLVLIAGSVSGVIAGFNFLNNLSFNGPLLTLLTYAVLVRADQRERIYQEVELSSAQERLQAQQKWRGVQQHFLSMLVHEIRTPLAVIQLGNRALARRTMDAAQKAVWEQRMDSAVSTIGQILDNCTQADRLEDSDQGAASCHFPIAALLRDIAEPLRTLNAQGGDRITLVFEPDILREAQVWADPEGVGTIVGNLLANALKYSAPASLVLLRVRALPNGPRPGLEIAVLNDIGPAGAPDPARLFERYYRAEAATRVSGTGLGLWLCQRLARRMQTEIRFAMIGPLVCFSFALWFDPA